MSDFIRERIPMGLIHEDLPHVPPILSSRHPGRSLPSSPYVGTISRPLLPQHVLIAYSESSTRLAQQGASSSQRFSC
ncbi:hypothetical protein TNCT_639451 [Trichonephila clavata]|uniref:Uncharacterized protein n=1 Tax=Trichonephila clavata TaxID=2740835 RepID=A0A8X6KWI1_TRICU|nr:hypothetical protein TNCT_639451 [Trichonephila clavata]